MRSRESRYTQFRLFSDRDRFNGYRERDLTLPEGIVEHSINTDNRLDHMGSNYYKKDRRWWRILDANTDYLYGFDLTDDENAGTVITIPASKDTK